MKIRENWRSTLFDFKNWPPTFAEKHMKNFVLEVTPKKGLHDFVVGENL